jgi:hypothetical protein
MITRSAASSSKSQKRKHVEESSSDSNADSEPREDEIHLEAGPGFLLTGFTV